MTSGASPYMPAAKLSAFLSLLQRKGVDGPGLLKACRIDPRILQTPEARIPLQIWLDLNRRAAVQLGDPDFGLHLGEVFQGMPTMLGYLMSACGTVREALHKYLRYQRLEHEGWRFLEHLQGSWVELDYQAYRSAAMDRCMIDFAFASLVNQYRVLTGHSLKVGRVHFMYARPSRIEEHQRILGSSLHFNDDRNAIVLPAMALDQPLIKANPAVRDHLEQPLRRALEVLDIREPFSVRVARVMGEDLHEGIPTLRDISKTLGMGTRSLQMRLQEEGTTFLQVRESMRQGLAKEYLSDPSITIQETAFLLGFSEPSAFHRAFRRWTGCTPSEYRSSNPQECEARA